MKVKNKTLKQNIIMKLKRHLGFRRAFADEVSTATPPTTSTEVPPVSTQQAPVAQPTQPVVAQPTVNFETLIASARKDEKDKLYPKLDALKADKEALIGKNNELLLRIGEKEATIGELTKEIETLKKGKADSEEVKTLKSTIATLEAENTQLKSEKEQAKLEEFKQAEIAKVGGKVIPELVTGTTEEEIKQSVELSNKRYSELLANAGVNLQSQAPTSPAPSTVQAPSYSTGFDFATVTPDMIAGMNAKEYAKYREQIGLK